MILRELTDKKRLAGVRGLPWGEMGALGEVEKKVKRCWILDSAKEGLNSGSSIQAKCPCACQ